MGNLDSKFKLHPFPWYFKRYSADALDTPLVISIKRGLDLRGIIKVFDVLFLNHLT